ncbi:MAG: GCN5-related N-acetyltransferase [Symbiobacteriaceae bacterium]|jgi:GNAT superfamily N-acetyltransferase|nr:GCN5-related N-acetyltransferase [Symbiobacteriaceae bacterium]
MAKEAIDLNIIIRTPRPEDIEAVVAISREGYPERSEDPKHWQDPDPRRYFVAEEDGEVVGYGCLRPDLPRQPEVPQYRLHLGVRPDRRGRSIGGRLYDHLYEALVSLRAENVWTRVRHTEFDTLAFLERRGFMDRQRQIYLTLEVAASVPQASPPQGIVITTLKDELAAHPDCYRAIHDLQNLCFADIPTANPTPLPSFDDFQKSMQDPALLFDGYFLAKAGERFVGLSYLAREGGGAPTTLSQRLTGTHPDFRRRGIAMALKACTLRYAREHGCRRIITRTNALNTGMLAVNRAMGFAHWYTDIQLHRPIGH